MFTKLKASFTGAGASKANNAFSDLIEQATSEANVSENWDLNMQICEAIVNAPKQPEGSKEAAKAIKARLLASKNPKVALLTLALLEMCVNNCGSAFYLVVFNKDLADISKYMQTAGLDESIRIKILDLVQQWNAGTRSDPNAQPVRDEFEKLKAAGMPFPPRRHDELGLISMVPAANLVQTPPPQAAPPQANMPPQHMQVQPPPPQGMPPMYAYPPQPVPTMNGQFMGQPFYLQQVPPPQPYMPYGYPAVQPYQPYPPMAQPPYQPPYQQQWGPPTPAVSQLRPVPPTPPQSDQWETLPASSPLPSSAPTTGQSIDDEIKLWQETVALFGEMLLYNDRTQPIMSNTVLVELKEQVETFRNRISNVLGDLNDDTKMMTILQINEKINVSIQTFEDAKKRGVAPAPPSRQQQQAQQSYQQSSYQESRSSYSPTTSSGSVYSSYSTPTTQTQPTYLTPVTPSVPTADLISFEEAPPIPQQQTQHSAVFQDMSEITFYGGQTPEASSTLLHQPSYMDPPLTSYPSQTSYHGGSTPSAPPTASNIPAHSIVNPFEDELAQGGFVPATQSTGGSGGSFNNFPPTSSFPAATSSHFPTSTSGSYPASTPGYTASPMSSSANAAQAHPSSTTARSDIEFF